MILARKPEDEVSAHEDASLVSAAYGVDGGGKVVSTIDVLKCLVIGTLDAVLDHHEGLMAESLDVVKEVCGMQSGRVPMTSPTTPSTERASSYIAFSCSNSPDVLV